MGQRPVHNQMFGDMKSLLKPGIPVSVTRVEVLLALIAELESKYNEMYEVGYHAGKLESADKIVGLRALLKIQKGQNGRSEVRNRPPGSKDASNGVKQKAPRKKAARVA